MNVADLICRHARVNPDGAAIFEPTSSRTLTWRQLDERSTGLANGFAELGLGRGDRVTMLARNCIEYVEFYLACAKAGCIAHGLNWRFALPAMVEALADAEPGLVLVQDDFADRAAEVQRELDGPAWRHFGAGSDGSYEDLIARGARWAGTLEASGGDDPFMIIYTGGTTGNSKGAVHSHASVVTSMANNTIAERTVPTDRYMLLGQAFHSSAVLALNYLRHGCPVVVVNFEPETALGAIDEYGVTAFLGYPTMMTYMLEQGTSGRFDLGSLRNIQYGGGTFAATTIFALLDTFPCTLIQCYGTSESVGVTFLSQEDHARARAEQPSLLRSCGVPAFLTDVRLSSDGDHGKFEGRPVGEILVRSRSNMLGYWSEWKRHGTATRPEWLSTGDLAYADDQGYLYIVGRSKDVIISGGENIYSPHVENAIFEHPAVFEAAVVGVADEVWGEAVAAYVVLRPGHSASESELQEWVRDRLGSYQKPKTVTFLDALPRTPTGKVLKRDLAPTSETGGT